MMAIPGGLAWQDDLHGRIYIMYSRLVGMPRLLIFQEITWQDMCEDGWYSRMVGIPGWLLLRDCWYGKLVCVTGLLF
jgi:hypothetical protein